LTILKVFKDINLKLSKALLSVMFFGLVLIVALNYFSNLSYICDALEANVVAIQGPIVREVYLDNLPYARAILSEKLKELKTAGSFLEGHVSDEKLNAKKCTSTVFYTHFRKPLKIGDSNFGLIKIEVFNYLFAVGIAVYILIFVIIGFLLSIANKKQLLLLKNQILAPIIELSEGGALNSNAKIFEIELVFKNMQELQRVMSINAAMKAELSLKEHIFSMAKQVAHDIRSPVTALLSASNLFKTKPEESIQLIKMAAERVDRIANDLLKNSKLNNSNFVHNSSVEKNIGMPQEISRLINEIVSGKRLEFAVQTNITLNEVIRENKRAMLSSSSLDLKRLLSNLINNSVEASCGNNTINIASHVSEHSTQIIITDEGAGIEPEIVEILNSDTNVSPTTTKANGHGLGLQSAKAELHKIGGQLTIKSKKGVGTIIDVRVPTVLVV
jgi:signal transduction histidine kinase